VIGQHDEDQAQEQGEEEQAKNSRLFHAAASVTVDLAPDGCDAKPSGVDVSSAH
jgi:hypothetical protein